jgi:hypothetical protein
MRRNKPWLLPAMIILGCCFIAEAAHAQIERTLYRQKGQYLPMPRDLKSYPAVHAGFSAAQIKVFNDNMAAFMELMHKTPCINPPKGFEVGTYGGICLDGSCHQSKVLAGSAGYIIREWTTTKDNPVPERAAEGPSINVLFNDSRSMLKRGVYDRTGFAEPLVVKTIAGCPVLEGGFVVITKIKKPLFKYISNETVLLAYIKDEEDAIENAKKNFSKGSAYQQWLRDKPATMKAVKEGMDILAKTNPADAKAKWEKIQADYAKMEEEMKQREAGELAENKKFIAAFETRLLDYKKKLANMPPEERKAPARHANGKKLVEPNPDFFDITRKSTDLQLVIIDLFRYDLDERLPHQLIREIRETLDIAALAAYIK